MGSRLIASGAGFATVVTAAGPAAAHAFVQRYDLPLPLSHYVAGAGAAVALTFVLLAIRGSRSRTAIGRDISSITLGRLLAAGWLSAVARTIALATFLVLIAAGLFGRQDDPTANILPITVWVIWWVGLAFVCALVGNVWAAINPWTAAARWVGRLSRRDRPFPTARRIGVWPAVVLFIGFAWMELVWVDNAVPSALAAAILIYSGVTWAGMARFGIDEWLRRGEVFSIVFGLFGRFAPLGRATDGRLVLRPYAVGLLDDREFPSRSLTILVITVLATVSFDGFLHTPPWREIFGAAFNSAYDAGLIAALGNIGARTAIMTVGLLLAPVLFLTIFLAVCRLTAVLAGPGVGTWSIARGFALSLVPIAIAYHLSHYLSLLLIEGQRLVGLVSDPFGLGWDLFGTAGYQPDIAIVEARFLWGFAVAAIVAGHAAAVWLAHLTALSMIERRRTAILSQLPMFVLMVAYTMLSLWILAQPIVEV